ncbi:MAG: dTDP-4-dehydrorhamnose 3,5-epimerase [Oscillospiraceae bacterium]|nr:dTDP-4-dehydrorhamnose 3,5-epimerase [Oscillospiraceae bacterium]
MKKIETGLDGAVIIEPDIFGDARGWFYESYSKTKLEQLGIYADFVQDNRSYSAQKGTLRGLHCQTEPKAQSKLLTCLRGAILDVAVDIRKGSPTYMKWTSVELSGENKRMFFIPKGCLHGFVTLTPDVEVSYKVDEYYSPENDRSIRFDDPSIGVDWGVENPILSAKDENAPLLADSDVEFNF